MSEILMIRLNEALETMAEAIRLAGERGAPAAIDHLANYLNDCDAVEAGDEEAYLRAQGRLAGASSEQLSEALPAPGHDPLLQVDPRIAAAEQRGAALAVEQVRRMAEEMAAEHLRHRDEAPPGSIGAYLHSDWAAALRNLIDKFPATPDLADKRLIKLRTECSAPGWDSYDAKPLTERALAVAEVVLLTPAAVVPTPAGGIQLEWHCGGEDVEIEILPDGTVVANDLAEEVRRIEEQPPAGSWENPGFEAWWNNRAGDAALAHEAFDAGAAAGYAEGESAAAGAERERWQSEEYPAAIRKGGEDMLEHAVKLAEEMVRRYEDTSADEATDDELAWMTSPPPALREFIRRLRESAP